MNKIIAVDYETYYDADYGIKQLGMDRYIAHSKFDPYLIAVSDGADSWAGEPKDFNWAALEGNTLLAHNKHFDARVQKEMVLRGTAPDVKHGAWHCTANMSAYLINQRSLADAAQGLLGVTLSKEVRDYAKGKDAAAIKADGKWEDMLGYGRSDAFHCWELFNKHGHKWPQHERDLSEMTIAQGTRGIQIDVDKLKTYVVIAQSALQIAEAQLPWVKEGRPPTSPKAIAELCRARGIAMPPVKSRDGEEAFIAWEKAYCKTNPWIEHVANWRSINKFLDSLETITTRLAPDGILGFSLKYFGAHTGRWAGDAGLNMQNLRKDPLYFDANLWLISDFTRLKEINSSPTLPAYVSQALDIRSLFIARPGKKLIISDLSQIEPRVLAWLVGDKPMLDLMAAGQSPYEAHARSTMGFTGGNMKKEDKDGYALAKARVLGLGFSCGWEKFIVVAQAMAGLDITKDDPEFIQAHNDAGEPCFDSGGQPILLSGYGYTSKKIVSDYRTQNPAVVALWRSLDDAFKASAGADFTMTLPSGRTMTYRDVRKERRTVRLPDGTLKLKQVYSAIVSGRRTVLYGGLLTENVVQATARDVFGYHLLRLDARTDLDVLFSVHDEAINEAELHVSADEVGHEMSQCPEWLAGCPLAAESSEAVHYKK